MNRKQTTSNQTAASPVAPANRRRVGIAVGAVAVAAAFVFSGCGTAAANPTGSAQAASSPSASPKPVDPKTVSAAVKGPHAGTYKMTRTGTGAGAVQEGVQDDPKDAAGNAQQTIVIQSPDMVTRVKVTYTADGVILNEQDANLGHGIVINCVFTTPVQLFPASIKFGSKWAVDGTCPVTIGSTSGTIHSVQSYEVTGLAKAAIGGHQGGAFVIHQTGTATLTTNLGVSTTTTDETHDFIPGLGLLVNSVVKTHQEFNGKVTDSDQTTTLNGLTLS